MLTSLNALDKKHHPIVPKEYPGVPSKKKLTKFISLLVHPDEITLLRQTLEGLFKVRLSKDKKLKYLDPSILNQYLYKSFQLNHDIYTKNLIWLDQINAQDSVWSVKNSEAVAFVNAYLVKTVPDYNFEQYSKKMEYWIKKADLDPTHSILYNASSLIASTYGNATNDAAFQNLDTLTKEKVYHVRPNTEYLQYDHAYSIISALKDATQIDARLLPLVERWNDFLSQVEAIKDQPSSYEAWKAANATKPQAEVEPEVKAEAEATKQ